MSPHTSLSFLGPSQSLPPKNGPMQLRVLFLNDPPHETEQWLQVNHSVKSPSTEKEFKSYEKNTLKRVPNILI